MERGESVRDRSLAGSGCRSIDSMTMLIDPDTPQQATSPSKTRAIFPSRGSLFVAAVVISAPLPDGFSSKLALMTRALCPILVL